ncbi:hypothetical protein EON67_12195 [archaeon]|nr:MAG: hypothetical protein EON67_12195 [archaeon]
MRSRALSALLSTRRVLLQLVPVEEPQDHVHQVSSSSVCDGGCGRLLPPPQSCVHSPSCGGGGAHKLELLGVPRVKGCVVYCWQPVGWLVRRLPLARTHATHTNTALPGACGWVGGVLRIVVERVQCGAGALAVC